MNTNSRKMGTALAVIAAVVVGFAGVAGAEPAFNPTTEVTSLLTDNIGALTTIALAIAAIAIPVALFFTYGNKVLGLVTGKSKKVKL